MSDQYWSSFNWVCDYAYNSYQRLFQYYNPKSEKSEEIVKMEPLSNQNLNPVIIIENFDEPGSDKNKTIQNYAIEKCQDKNDPTITNSDDQTVNIINREVESPICDFKITESEETENNVESNEDLKSESVTISCTVRTKTKKMNTIEDYFTQRMLNDIIKEEFDLRNPTNESKNTNLRKLKKQNLKTYHDKLLENLINSGSSRGKMIKYVEFNCYNSDEDSSDYSGDECFDDPSSLYQRYSLASRIVDSSSRVLPKWDKKQKMKKNNYIKEKETTDESAG
jgi:hypothetical protein